MIAGLAKNLNPKAYHEAKIRANYMKLGKENLVDLLIQAEQRLIDAYKVK